MGISQRFRRFFMITKEEFPTAAATESLRAKPTRQLTVEITVGPLIQPRTVADSACHPVRAQTARPTLPTSLTTTARYNTPGPTMVPTPARAALTTSSRRADTTLEPKRDALIPGVAIAETCGLPISSCPSM